MSASPANKSLPLIGASRGPGFAFAEEDLRRGCHMVVTVRAPRVLLRL